MTLAPTKIECQLGMLCRTAAQKKKAERSVSSAVKDNQDSIFHLQVLQPG